jgi:hypothetical protein
MMDVPIFIVLKFPAGEMEVRDVVPGKALYSYYRSTLKGPLEIYSW